MWTFTPFDGDDNKKPKELIVNDWTSIIFVLKCARSKLGIVPPNVDLHKLPVKLIYSNAHTPEY